MQHSLSSWLFNDDLTPVEAEQDDVSKYFESAFRALLKKFGSGGINLDALIETVFSFVPTDEKGDSISVDVSLDSLIEYIEKILKLGRGDFENLKQLFSTLMDCLKKHLKSVSKDGFYDTVIITHILVTGMADLISSKEIKRVLSFFMDCIRTRKMDISFGGIMNYFLNEEFNKICGRIQGVCSKSMKTLCENGRFFCNTHKGSVYELTARVFHYVGTVAGKLVGISSTNIIANFTGKKPVFYGKMILCMWDLYSKGLGSLPPVFDVPEKDVLSKTVNANTKDFSDLKKRCVEITNPLQSISIKCDTRLCSGSKVKLNAEITNSSKTAYKLRIMKLGIDPSEDDGKMALREIKSEDVSSKAVKHIIETEMDTFGIYLVRVLSWNEKLICQACVSYLPKVDLVPLAKRTVVEVNYTISDEKTKAIMDLSEWEKKAWWVGIFQKDERGCASLVSSEPCGNSEDKGRVFLGVPRSRGEYFVRFYTSYTAGYCNEVPITVDPPQVPPLKARRVILPERGSSIFLEGNRDAVVICVDWALAPGVRKTTSCIGLFTADRPEPIQISYLSESERNGKHRGRIRFCLTQEEGDRLKSIRLYSDEDECIGELDRKDVKWEEEVLFSRHGKCLKWTEKGNLEWSNINPNSSTVFVVSPSPSGPHDVRIKAPNGGFVCVKGLGVSLSGNEAEASVFSVISNKDRTVSFRVYNGSIYSNSKEGYLAIDETGNMYVMGNYFHDHVKFVCSKLQKEERYTIHKKDGLYLTSTDLNNPTLGAKDGTHEFLSIFFLSRTRDIAKVIVRFENSHYLSKSNDSKLCYSGVITLKEVFGMRLTPGTRSEGVMRLDVGSGVEEFEVKRWDPYLIK